MVRRASWRTAPDDPRAPVGWFLADAEAGSLGPFPAFFALSALLSLALVWSPWTLLGLPLLALNVRRAPKPHDLSALRTLPPPGPAFACRIDLLTNGGAMTQGTLLGTDEGVATFVDGWLHVAGRRTDFALRRSDLASAESGILGLRLGLPSGHAAMLVPLDGRDADRLIQAFRVWSKGSSVPEGEPRLPPTGVHATGLARAWHGAFLSVAGLLAFIGLLLALGQGVFLTFLWSGGFVSSFRRLAELRRFAREESSALGRD